MTRNAHGVVLMTALLDLKVSSFGREVPPRGYFS
jgi:hypothetical protein